MVSTQDDPRLVSVLLLREPVSVLQGTDAYHDVFGSFCLPSFSLSALESGASTPRNSSGTPVQLVDAEQSGSHSHDRSLLLGHNIFQDNTYLMTHHIDPDDNQREFWVVSYPVLTHRLENIALLADRILQGVHNESYDAVIITSKRAVQAWIEACKQVTPILKKRLADRQSSETLWKKVPYYVVGPATAKTLSSANIDPMLQPEEIVGASDTGTGEALAQKITQRLAEQKPGRQSKFLYLVGSKHSLTLQETLEKNQAPATLDEICVYTTEKDPQLAYHCRLLAKELPFVDASQGNARIPSTASHQVTAKQLSGRGSRESSPTVENGLSAKSTNNIGLAPDWIAFFSPSGAEYALPDLRAQHWIPTPDSNSTAKQPKIACIGPTTATWVRENLQFEPDAIAAQPTPASLREAIIQAEHK
ncbi:uroporphyrinogen-III synthase [Malassezia yamatoensis]|uniref:Uroporphyrinogen-III synthase n=1 Tax=Malassezia yamatoensis TaxID=253288 RepID=A0AAJ6CEU1_9BASI|nr:uroporphyrinogen-III synthase [Malassezia yamatoensis]